MNIFKLIVVGLMFASANAGCQPSNERTECTANTVWAAEEGISSSDPKYKCACKDASGKYNALCSPGQTCTSTGTCSGTPTQSPSTSPSPSSSSSCSGLSMNMCQNTSGCTYVNGNCQSSSSPAPSPSSSCNPTDCALKTLETLCNSPCVWTPTSSATGTCGC